MSDHPATDGAQHARELAVAALILAGELFDELCERDLSRGSKMAMRILARAEERREGQTGAAEPIELVRRLLHSHVSMLSG